MEARGKAVQATERSDQLSQLKRQFDQWRAGRKAGSGLARGVDDELHRVAGRAVDGPLERPVWPHSSGYGAGQGHDNFN